MENALKKQNCFQWKMHDSAGALALYQLIIGLSLCSLISPRTR